MSRITKGARSQVHLRPGKFTDQHFAIVNEMLNEMLNGLSADGAYRMGLVSTLAIMAGVEPTGELFERAVQASSPAEVATWFEEYRLAAEGKKKVRKKKP